MQKTAVSSGTGEKSEQKGAVVSSSEGGTSKLQCFKCFNHGTHVTKDCDAEVLCVNCDKTSHISEKCAWLHQRKPVASFVGFRGEGLGCFVAEHANDTATGAKGTAMALIRVKDLWVRSLQKTWKKVLQIPTRGGGRGRQKMWPLEHFLCVSSL